MARRRAVRWSTIEPRAVGLGDAVVDQALV